MSEQDWELDAWLAERLFGWPISQLEAPLGCPDFLEQWTEAHVPHYSTTGDGMLKEWGIVPHDVLPSPDEEDE